MDIKRYSENAVTVYIGDEISETVNKTLVNLKNELENRGTDGVTEIVISYTSLIIYFDLFKVRGEELEALLKEIDLEALEGQPFEYKLIEIPVCYGGEFGPDLDRFEEDGLSPEEVVEMHSGTEYLVYMLGFMPGFPYLGGLDEKLFKDRLDNPRTSIPAGSVGIGGKQTGMYPFTSPGGWNLLGRTPVPLFDEEREPSILYEAGDRIIFKSIDEDEYKAIEQQVADGVYEVNITRREAE
ncbi:5-oxoprolinase subunit PxpB [Salinicoccus halitifaciens]|uniref:KipI family sensor histidine kinase inhibitor n=1 Tax=Salinicoccus halitifaciens TaxID=1073415 RepID=A0ABV2EAI9_9STAP|nr:5-oxoprolinase subunit PxpB [Salinicoccus halitifaciens]MCD2138567.1 5-oxoprolinase subunit PxpB [Salinicoccus halitifaciens]